MKTHFAKWLLAIAMMLVIFWFSAQPGYDPLTFDWLDAIFKKGGHMIGYGLLVLSYWQAFDFKEEKRWIVWLLAVLYAVTDEFHQSFVPGRNPSIWDFFFFYILVAFFALCFLIYFIREKRPGSIRPVAEEAKR
jgi:VanZ family protein